MRTRATGAVGLGVVVFGFGGVAWGASRPSDPTAERGAEAAYTAAHRSQALVSQAEAERDAISAHPGAVVDSHLENESGGLRWETKLSTASGLWEVQIDATVGQIVSSHADD